MQSSQSPQIKRRRSLFTELSRTQPVPSCQGVRSNPKAYTGWKLWCRAQQVQTYHHFASPLAWARSSIAGRNVLLVQQGETKLLMVQQVPLPAITQGEKPFIKKEKPDALLQTRTNLAMDCVFKIHEQYRKASPIEKTAHILRYTSD